MRIQKFKQDDSGFWNLIGPFLVSLKVRQKIGTAINSDETYKWFIAIDKQGAVLGFCATCPDKGKVFRVRYAYVVSGDLDLKAKLIQSAAKDGPAIKKSLVRTDFPSWENAGFEYTGKKKGSYKEMIFKGAE